MSIINFVVVHVMHTSSRPITRSVTGCIIISFSQVTDKPEVDASHESQSRKWLGDIRLCVN
jgi:hypothetical protein